MAGERTDIGLEIRAMKKAAEKLPPYRRPDCPICGWTLEETPDQLIHCRFCGWTDQFPIQRDVSNDQ